MSCTLTPTIFSVVSFPNEENDNGDGNYQLEGMRLKMMRSEWYRQDILSERESERKTYWLIN